MSDIESHNKSGDSKSLPATIKRDDLAINIPDVLKESYFWTSSIRNIGKYGERLCDAITQAVHQAQTGQFSCGILDVVMNSDESRTLTIDLRRVMANSLDKNFVAAELSLLALQHVIFTYKEDGVFKSRALITDANLDENDGPGNHAIKFRISSEVWEKFTPGAENFRLFNPLFAFKYPPSVYKLYKLLLGNFTHPISYALDELMAMLHDDNTVTYKSMVGKKISPKRKIDDSKPPVVNMRYADFSRRVLDTTKKILQEDPDCPFFFDYIGESTVKEKQRGRPKVDKITFFVKMKKDAPKNKDYACDFNNKLEIDAMPSKLLDYLDQTYEISRGEAERSHIIAPAYFCMLQHGDSLSSFLTDTDNKNRIIKSGPTVAGRKAYIFGMLKKHCKEAYGVDLGRARSDVSSASTLKAITQSPTNSPSPKKK